MADLSPRLGCPVCPGVRMERIRVSPTARLYLDHCPRCGGVWFEDGEARKLGRAAAALFWGRVARRTHAAAMACRGCTGTLGRRDEACGECGWKNVLDCPSCDQPLRREHRNGVDVDVCRHCRAAWFDRHELDAIWRSQAAVTAGAAPVHAVQGGSWGGNALSDAANVVDTIYFADVSAHVGAGLVRAAGDGAAELPDTAAGAFEAATGLVEVVGAVAEGAFRVVGGVLELLFGLLEGL